MRQTAQIRPSYSSSEDGFTLLEMLVVIVIMAVLLGMTLRIGNNATREAAVESSAMEFARTVRATSMRARLEKVPYTLVMNTTTRDAESIRWHHLGPEGFESEFTSGLKPADEVLQSYTDTYFDMTGENHWYAVVKGISIEAEDLIPDHTGGRLPIGGILNIPRYDNYLTWFRDLKVDSTKYFFYPMGEFTVFDTDRTTVEYDASNPPNPSHSDPNKLGTPELYEERSWVLGGTYPYPSQNINPYNLQQGPNHKLRSGVRFWNVHTDFDDTKPEGEYIPGFAKLTISGTPEPAVHDLRTGGVGYPAYRALGMLHPDFKSSSGKRYRTIGMQYHFRPGNGEVNLTPNGNGVFTTFGGYYGLGMHMQADDFYTGSMRQTAGQEFLTRFNGMVDVEDLSIYRIIQMDQGSGLINVSKKPKVSW